MFEGVKDLTENPQVKGSCSCKQHPERQTLGMAAYNSSLESSWPFSMLAYYIGIHTVGSGHTINV